MTTDSMNNFLNSFTSAFDFMGSCIMNFINVVMSYPVTYWALFLFFVLPALAFIILWLQKEVNGSIPTSYNPRSIVPRNLDRRIRPRIIGSFGFPVNVHKMLGHSIKSYRRSVEYKEASAHASEYFKKYPNEKYYSFKGFKFFNEQYLPKQYKHRNNSSSDSTERYNNRSLDIPYDED